MVKVGRNNLETIVLIFVLRLQEINNNNKKSEGIEGLQNSVNEDGSKDWKRNMELLHSQYFPT